jgi:hypothetical protein
MLDTSLQEHDAVHDTPTTGYLLLEKERWLMDSGYGHLAICVRTDPQRSRIQKKSDRVQHQVGYS